MYCIWKSGTSNTARFNMTSFLKESWSVANWCASLHTDELSESQNSRYLLLITNNYIQIFCYKFVTRFTTITCALMYSELVKATICQKKGNIIVKTLQHVFVVRNWHLAAEWHINNVTYPHSCFNLFSPTWMSEMHT